MFCTKSSSSENDQDGTPQDNTLYENILSKQEDEQQLEKKQNVAYNYYGPLRYSVSCSSQHTTA